MSVDPVFELHRGGKMAVVPTVPLATREDLSLAYTPGVARVCEAIAADEALVNQYTWVGHTVAVVTDGSAVLGLGNIGPRAAMPVMEGKAVLFKQFGDVDAVPICLATQDPDEIVSVVTALAPSFGGINLEDISAPRCFDIERELAAITNAAGVTGGIAESLRGADVLIGVSGGTIDASALSGMAPGGAIFALANPTPEVHPDIARNHAAIVATGRSDFPNQINNVLAFPGVFRGALDAGATRITDGMKIAAADAIASIVANELRREAIVPSPLDPRVALAVAEAVAQAAARDGVTRQ